MLSRRTFLFGSAIAGLGAVASSNFFAAKFFDAFLSIRSAIAAYRAEQKLIQQLRAGEPTAYRHFYKRYLGLVYTYIRKHVSTIVDAKEMTIDVFITAGRNLANQQHIGLSLSAWLLRLAKEQVIQGPRPSNLTKFLHPAEEENQLIAQALATLSPQQQKVVYWAFYKQYSNLEISRLLQISEFAIRIRKYRAVKQITHILSKSSGPNLN